jgi:hypothetical protein
LNCFARAKPESTPVVTLTKVRVYGRKRGPNAHDRSPGEAAAGDSAHHLAFALMDPDFRQEDGNQKVAPNAR